MKKVFLVITAIFGSLTLMAQQPERPILRNQFRDFVEFQKLQEKPKIEKKDGKVIITMSQAQFNRMQKMRQMRMRQGNFRQVNLRQPMVCQNCKKCKKKQQSNRPKRLERRF
jgi:hypothetical protein